MPEKSIILRLNDIQKSFKIGKHGVDALKNIDMTIYKGSITGIIGRSGAGKSTLLRCMNALEKPCGGRVYFEGQDLCSAKGTLLRKARSHIGMIFQHFNLLSRKTVEANVALPLQIAGFSKQNTAEKVAKCLALVGLSDKAKHYPNQLSGGQKQRVAIARALVNEVKILLCDEATSALDPETTTEILNLLKKLNQDLGLTIVLITHEIQVIKQICDYVYVLDHGRLIEEGPVESIFAHPKEPITETLVDSVFNKAIPDIISEQLRLTRQSEADHIVYRLLFTSKTAQEPIISKLIRDCSVEINIVSGFIEHIGKTLIGTLIVTIPCTDHFAKSCEGFWKEHLIHYEVLGYIKLS